MAFKPLSAEVLTNLFKKHLRCLRSSAGEAFEAPGLPRSLARRPAREDMGFLGTSSPDASTPSSRPLLCPWSSASHQQDMPDKSSEIFRDHRDKFSSSQPSQAPVAEPAGCQVPQDDDRITCLVAEDDRVSMMMMKKLLEKANMKMIPALNGVEAVVAAMEKPVDIILMDCNMPLKVLRLPAFSFSTAHCVGPDSGLCKPCFDVN